MGATTFGTIQVGTYKDEQEAYKAAVKEAELEYGQNPYNGTISTTEAVFLFRNAPRFNTAKFNAWEDEKLENVEGGIIEKFGKCGAVEIKGVELKRLKESCGLKGKRGVKAYYFFGWAAC